MRIRRLLRYRLRAAGRRLTGGAWWARALALAAAVAALAGVWVGMDALASADLALMATPQVGERAVREHIFWLGALMVLVFAYTTFEVFFRASDRRLVGTLPIEGATRYADLTLRALFVHLPLAAPLLGYAAALAARGAGTPAAYAALMAATLYLVGIPLCIWVHLLAGRSLMGEGTNLQKMMAGGLVADEAAMLMWAPAAGLLVTLVLGIFAELLLRDALVDGKRSALAMVLGGGAALAILAVAQGRRICDAYLHRIMPRFSELDVAPPFRDDGVKKRILGEGLADLLPPAARPYFLRDLRQLRRRFRLDRVLIVVFGVAALRLNLAGDGPASLGTNLIAIGLASGLFLGSAFRLHGRELASPWLALAFPVDRRAAWLGRFCADVIGPLWTVALATASVTVTGDLAAAALVLAAGTGVAVALVISSQALAARAFPDRVLAAAAAWRASLIAAIGVAIWQLS